MSEVERALRAAGIDPSSGTAFGPTMTAYALPGRAALDAWSKLRAAVPSTHSWPLLLGARDSLQCHRDLLAEHSPVEAIAEAEQLDAAEALRARLDEIEEDGDLPRGEWPASVEPSSEIGIHLDLSGNPRREVFLVLAPTPDAWRAVAHVPFGGWNDCPAPAEHVAVFKHWAARWGAVPVGVTKDTIECMVGAPPTTRDAALALAHEQYAYASDIVDQGTDTIDALAATLLNGTAWFFWWD